MRIGRELEVGKLYMTRDGRKARLYIVNEFEKYAHGAIFNDLPSGPFWQACGWSDKGLNGNDDCDLVSEWADSKPPVRLHAWIDLCTELEMGRQIYFTRFTEDESPPSDHPWTRAPWLDPPKDWQP